MEIKGTVNSIIFHNEQNGYTVLELDVDGDQIIATGYYARAVEGEELRLVGEFRLNPKYGEQFVATSIYSVAPETPESMVRFLASGLISGVREATAQKIVSKFGKNSFNIIENHPEKLAKIKGISEEKAKAISQSFKEASEVRNAIMLLQQYDISTAMALRICRVYGTAAKTVITTNPYRLVEDIDGIGFKTADKIALAVGIPKDSVFRLRAGIIHVLTDAARSNGHTCLPQKTLINEAASLLKLELDAQKIDGLLKDMAIEGVVKLSKKEDADFVALMSLYMSEKIIAEKLVNLLNYTNDIRTDYSQYIELFESENGYSFDASQKDAINSCLNDGVMIVTGGPGTGKTTILKCVIYILKIKGSSPLLLAPTGRAAKRISESCGEPAQTIHRALVPNFSGKGFIYNENNPLPSDFIVVDEVSMVDAYLMASLLKAIRPGARLVLMGDKDQLPSVGAGNVLSDLLKSGKLKVTVLKYIYRQAKQSLIISNAHLINSGKMPVLDNSPGSDFFFSEVDDTQEIANTVVDMATRRIPSYLGISPLNVQVLAPMKNGPAGINNLNIELQSRLNPKRGRNGLRAGAFTFFKGDKVMHIVNNYDLEWIKVNPGGIIEEGKGVFNGDIGSITGINHNTYELTVEFEDGRSVVYTREFMDELTPAYAITIHKSQGCEFDVVVIPIISGNYMILTRNLLYTAVTRAKQMVVLVGSRKSLRLMVRNNYQSARSTQLAGLLEQAFSKLCMLEG